jgi:hypothetical protein
VAIGLAVGWLMSLIRERTTDDQVNVTLSLLSGYAAYVPADAVGASGVLAAVTAGIYMGIRGPGILPVRTRLQGYFVWDIVDFMLNTILFVLIGRSGDAIPDGSQSSAVAPSDPSHIPRRISTPAGRGEPSDRLNVRLTSSMDGCACGYPGLPTEHGTRSAG